MNIESPARLREPAPSIGSDELAEGLMLVRASTLKMIRLQLAIERHDRRGALQAVDDLVALDGRLQDYLAEVSAADTQLLFRNELNGERALLNQEKLSLVAGVIRRPPEPLFEEPADDDWLGPRDLPDQYEEAPRRMRWWIAAMAAIPAAASAAAACAYVAGVPQMQSWIAAATGAFQ